MFLPYLNKVLIIIIIIIIIIRISKDLVNHLRIKICDKILENIARRFDVSRTSLSSESKMYEVEYI